MSPKSEPSELFSKLFLLALDHGFNSISDNPGPLIPFTLTVAGAESPDLARHLGAACPSPWSMLGEPSRANAARSRCTRSHGTDLRWSMAFSRTPSSWKPARLMPPRAWCSSSATPHLRRGSCGAGVARRSGSLPSSRECPPASGRGAKPRPRPGSCVGTPTPRGSTRDEVGVPGEGRARMPIQRGPADTGSHPRFWLWRRCSGETGSAGLDNAPALLNTEANTSLSAVSLASDMPGAFR